MLNVVAIMGRLAADPQLRQTTTGKNVASFRIACDRGRRDANGQSQADWLDVVAWDRTAEFVCKYFQKGSLIAIDGRLQSRIRTRTATTAPRLRSWPTTSTLPLLNPQTPHRWVMPATAHPWQPPPPVLLCRPILRRAILPVATMTLH